MASHKAVAVFVDGENLSAAYATQILQSARSLGRVDVCRAYGDATRSPSWDVASGFRLIHSGRGKNATDVLLSIDAMDYACTGRCDAIIIAASDGDYTHLATRLREKAIHVLGVGEAKAPEAFRAACSAFKEAALCETGAASNTVSEIGNGRADRAYSSLDLNIKKVIAARSRNGAGMPLKTLGVLMARNHDVMISKRPEGTWRKYLKSRSWLFDIDEPGPEAMVRYCPEGFARGS